jgi:hypothetical protein
MPAINGHHPHYKTKTSPTNNSFTLSASSFYRFGSSIWSAVTLKQSAALFVNRKRVPIVLACESG